MKNYKNGPAEQVLADEIPSVLIDDEALLMDWVEYCELGIRWAWDERYPPGVQP